ncbi:MAG TPA: ABC transporter permease subunit, partial [Tepidisphaeraceae bacterium]|nr:ABC transporter permease subunit [Tepidisphaeraceae bacterium]
QGFLSGWSKWDKALWLAPAVHAARWLPVVAVLGFAVAWVVSAVARRRGARDPGVRRARRVVGLMALIAGAAVIGAEYFKPNPGWAWLYPIDWQWPDPTSLYWRGFSAEHWWPIGAGQTITGVIFTPLAIAMASVFVTFPFVARSLIPLMETQGIEAEAAALTLGASGWYTFRRVTLPSIKWGLLYGAILCTARAMGEFGAVSVVSGHLDSNDTMPLRIEKLWQEYKTQPAFAVASLLAMLAVVTLILKGIVELKSRRDRDDGGVARVAATKPGH